MRLNVTEITQVLGAHEYSINNIICEVMKKFKLKTLCWEVGVKKQDGYKATEILALLVMFPLMLLNSVHGLYKKEYQKITTMKKDTIYRFKNDERIPWRKLLYAVGKQFQKLVGVEQEVAAKSAFIIDDTIDSRVGYKIENTTKVFDHVAGKKGVKYGFKHLVLGFFDGKSLIPLDFGTHTEKKLDRRQRKEQFKKECRPNSQGAKRRQESKLDKITNAILLVKRAVKNGFRARYVLVDSWFSSKDFIQEIRGIKDGILHVVAGVRNDSRLYLYEGEHLNAKGIIKKHVNTGKVKRCRKWNTRYIEVLLTYEGVGEVKLYISRFPYQKKWRVFISTDTSLSFTEMLEIYGTRWTIEVMFRELKQHLCLGKCQSRDFDAQIASITISMILYIFLIYLKRKGDYETTGELLRLIHEDMCEKNLAEKIWSLFEELLQIVIDCISANGDVNLIDFRKSPEYQYIKGLFDDSFLGNQLMSVDKSA